ncbi:MAG: hypothetical protein KatS3mg111_1106 [Pirellulaceae bacterium]|nr:MAG: hypothetical protein KatS3mg111_1106 [Pirellulaceae bacterium]
MNEQVPPEKEFGELDVVCGEDVVGDGNRSLASDGPAGNSRQGGSVSSGPQRRPTVAVWFRCCQVYAHLSIPSQVQSGQWKVWRVHCVRCGRLSEVFLETGRTSSQKR